MKKAIVLLLALAVLGGAGFAQDDAPALKLSGALYGGLVYANGDGAGLKFDRWYGSVPDAFRVRLNAQLTAGNSGLKFRLQSNDFSAPVITQGYMWSGFLDNMIKVKLGKLDDYTFATVYNAYGNFDGVTGAEFILAPIDGLKIGAFVPVALPNTVAIADQFAGTDFGLAYAIPDVANIVAGYQLGENVMWAGVDVKAIENVLARVEAKLTFDTSTYVIWERVAYTMDALTLQLSSKQTITDALALNVTPNVEYALDFGAIGAGVGIDLAGTDLTISIDPYLDYNVDSGSIEIGAGIPVMTPAGFSVYAFYSYSF